MPTDEEIEAKLNSLKEYVKQMNPQYEIEERLARLTDRDPSYYSSNNHPIRLILPQNSGITDDEKSDALLQNIMQELSIDEQRSKEFEAFECNINERLSKIESFTNQLPQPQNNSTTIQPIVLDELDLVDTNQNEDMENWCTTCNEDATVACHDCEGDVYCSECFRELHRDPDLRGHRASSLHKK